MIVSFHPCFEADRNIICAGREPGREDLAAIKAADAVILPQGCGRSLYDMARGNCLNVFPNYDARFKYPGKLGQIELFGATKAAHPQSATYENVHAFSGHDGELPSKPLVGLPCVFKFDWGGEGDNVYLINCLRQLREVLGKALAYEKTGQNGFIIQEYIPAQGRTLRVVVIGQRIIPYWRIQKDTANFRANLSQGAVIDTDSDPGLQERAIESLKDFLNQTAIDLAGFDFLFSTGKDKGTPLFLEINYFFGRRGLGGSEKYYALLQAEIKRWLEGLAL